MSRLRVGFIGAGRIADLHALGYDGNAICDADGGGQAGHRPR